jgi:hypothetical protein
MRVAEVVQQPIASANRSGGSGLITRAPAFFESALPNYRRLGPLATSWQGVAG